MKVGAGGTALVTGASGFIGRRLLQPGERALVRRPSGLPDEVLGDLLDPASCARACEGVETVFHCAGLADAQARDLDALWRANVVGTQHLLAAAGSAGVKRFVFLSSVKAMADPGAECIDEDWPGEPATLYGKAKRAAEAAVLEAGAKYGMHVVNLRLALVYGRGSRGNLWKMARGIHAGWFPRLPETGARRSLVHVADVVAAARLVAARPEANGRTYIVADPRPYSARELYEAIRAVPPAPTFSWSVPAWALRAAGRLHPRLDEIVEWLIGSACYSPARIERELGFRARIGLQEGLREMLAEG
ncbi:MAG: NAD-dependent epimerase/dehydratase family protein [Rhodocyclaceae bacterium]|nr:NAD-dependent epimerase/dehydratase family protein [Rhodocyclaceae bacterium]